MRISQVNRIRFTAGAILALALSASPAAADDRFWNAGIDGAFGDAERWDDGMSGVPGGGDSAVFDVGSLYTVDFLATRATDRVLLRSGLVTFDLGAVSYELLNPIPTTPGVSIGVDDGDVADLTIIGGTLASVFTDVGEQPGSLGLLDVSGPDGVLDVEQYLRVGDGGNGFLDVTGGAAVTSVFGSIGHSTEALGAVAVAGPGSWWLCEDRLTIGKSGAGELSITSGAAVECADAVIASVDYSIGAVTVAGAGSQWVIDGTLDVGLNGVGALLIEDGARVTTSGFVTIGTFPGGLSDPPEVDAVGSVTVDGRGTSLSIEGGFFEGDLYVGFLSVGTLTVSRGATVEAAGFLSINDEILHADDASLTFVLGAADDYPSPAITAIGALEVFMFSARGRVALADGFVPSPGDTFALLEVSDDANLLDLEVPPLPGNLVWYVRRTSTSVDLEVFPEECVVPGPGEDCNDNGIDDQCDIEFGADTDCNGNGILDSCDLDDFGSSFDCNANGVPDECDVDLGTSGDCNGNGIPDECETTQRDQKIAPGSVTDGAEFGTSIDIDDDRAIIGAPFDGQIGTARIYSFDGNQWAETAVLSSPSGPDTSRYGESVALDGDLAIVGASGFRNGADEAVGATFIYRFDGAQWQQESQLLASDGVNGARFGHAVAIDGDVAIVGAIWDGGVAFAAGAAYVYRFDGAAWSEEQKLTLFLGEFGDMLGSSVTVAGHTTIVGAEGSDEAYVFTFDGAAWSLQQTLTPPDTSLQGSRGSIDLSGDRLVVGGRLPNGAETVYVYHHVGAVWTPEALLAPHGDVAGSEFGAAVAINGDTIVVGAPLDDDGAEDAGAAFVFRRIGDAWTAQGRLGNSENDAGDFLGGVVAIDGDRVLAGAVGDGQQGDGAGAAFAFDLVITDCNANGVPDDCDIASGASEDQDGNGIPDECTCDGDVDGSGAVDFADLLEVLFAWGPCPGCPADLDGDGEVGFADLLTILFNWGVCA